MGVQQPLSVADQEVFADGVDAVVDAPGILYLLDAEGHEDGGALGGEGAGGLDAAQAIGQGGVQPVLLLVAQDGELAKALVTDGLQGLGVRVQLLQRVGHVDQGDIGEDHALVAGAEVVQELLILCPELFQLIGDGGGKVVVGVLLLLPAGDVALHAQDAGLHFLHGLVGGNGQNVDGQHKVPGEVGQVGNHAVLDVAGVLPEEQDAAHLAAQLEVVRFELHPVRGDGVLEVMAPAHGGGEVELKVPFLAGPEEVMEDPQALVVVQGLGPAVQLAKALGQVNVHPLEKGAGLVDAFPGNGDRDVLVLNEIVALQRLFGEDAVVLLAVAVQLVPFQPHEDAVLEVSAIETAVVDGDFGGGPGGQAVENAAVGQKHFLLVLMGRHGVVDVRKPPRPAVPIAASLPDAVPEYPPDGDGLLHTAGNFERFPFALVGGGQGFNHSLVPPFSSAPRRRGFPTGTPWARRRGIEISKRPIGIAQRSCHCTGKSR